MIKIVLGVLTLAYTLETASSPTMMFVAGQRIGYVMNQSVAGPRPTIFVLGGSVETSFQPVFRDVADQLVHEGWLHVGVDLPSHGALIRPGETDPLTAWRDRTITGELWIPKWVEDMKQVLNEGIAMKAVDPNRIVLLGFSRGGFLAMHWAARDPRIRAVVAVQPITDLARLPQWIGIDPSIAIPWRSPVVSTPVFLPIGAADTIVGTDSAMQLAQEAWTVQAPLTIQLWPTTLNQNHTIPNPAELTAQVAAWVRIKTQH